MDLTRNATQQLSRTQQDDTTSTTRQDEPNVGPFSNVLFREIHKNGFLRKLSVERKMGAFPKKGEKVWVVFCVHDDSEPLLEIYNCKNKAVTHKPDWFVSLNNCLHVSPTICPQEDEYEFVITLNSDIVRLTAPSWELMIEWVECISAKLREMHILSPRENVYSKNPETGPKLPLAPTRDPNSPLPLPPAGPATSVPGIEQVTTENTDQDIDSSNVTVTNSEVSTSSHQELNYSNSSIQPRPCTTSLYITQSEPSTYSRSHPVLCRASSVPDSSSLNVLSSCSLPIQTETGSTYDSVPNTDNNITVVCVNTGRVPHSADCQPSAVFDFSPVMPNTSLNLNEPQYATGENRDNDVDHSPVENRILETEQNSVDVEAGRRSSSNFPVDLPESGASHYECVFLAHTPAESAITPVTVTSDERNVINSPRIAQTLQETFVISDNRQQNERIRTVSASDGASAKPLVVLGAMQPSGLHTGSEMERQTAALATTSAPGVPRCTDRREIISGSSPRTDSGRRPVNSFVSNVDRLESGTGSTSRVIGNTSRTMGPTQIAGCPVERTENSGAAAAAAATTTTRTGPPANRGPVRHDVVFGVASRGIDIERQLQPAPHPYHRQMSLETGSSATSGGTSRMTLREQQVFQLRREMAHPGGVRLQLRRKDCVGSVALVDVFGSVWIAGWKQREHPMLYNALHIGDQLLTVAGVPVQSATDANRLIRGAMGLYVELVIRRVPFGRVFAVHREAEGQSLGLVQEGNTAEVREIASNSPAARAGLPSRAPTCDGLSLTTWTLTEINGRPLNLFFKDGEVRDRLNAVGKEVSVLVQPSDLIRHLKKQLKAIRSYKDYIVQ